MPEIEIPIGTQKVAADHALKIWEALGANGAEEQDVAPMIMALNHVSARLSDFLCSEEVK